VVSILGVRVCQDLRIGHGIEQAEAEDLGDPAPRDCRRGGRNRLAIDAERRMQCRRDVILEDESALSHELVALTANGIRMERCGVALDLVTRPARNGILVTFLAPVRIEQRPEPLLRREDAVEHDAAAVELRPLGG